jgi:hypothetical protein
MNVSQVASAPVASQPSVEVKRAALQALLLKKSLEGQQNQADAISREAEGKGSLLDIRV